MNVLHFSTVVGIGSACTKLHKALKVQKVNSSIYVSYNCDDIEDVYVCESKEYSRFIQKIINKFNRIILKFQKDIFEKKYNLIAGMPYSGGEKGKIINNKSIIKQADILHLHWICNLLSVNQIKRLSKLKKPVVWTFHDIWPLTGGCHCEFNCDKYIAGLCGECMLLNSSQKRDVAYRLMQHKIKEFCNINFTIIAPSHWMEQRAKMSPIFKNSTVVCIPNAVDTDIFRAREKEYSDKINILFGAHAIKSPYKGFIYLVELLKKIEYEHTKLINKICIHLVGDVSEKINELDEYDCKYWGFINDNNKMAELYSMTDVMIYPSICDNLPNMVMESLACETPVVAFDTGGISDMIEHKKNGYIAEYKNVDDLLKGLLWVIDNNKDNILGKAGRRKVLNEFAKDIIAQKHIELYRKLLNNI